MPDDDRGKLIHSIESLQTTVEKAGPAATVSYSLIGAIGVMTAFRYAATVAPELAARSACYGSAMALHVVVLALILVILGGIVTGVGSRRQALQRITP